MLGACRFSEVPHALEPVMMPTFPEKPASKVTARQSAAPPAASRLQAQSHVQVQAAAAMAKIAQFTKAR